MDFLSEDDDVLIHIVDIGVFQFQPFTFTLCLMVMQWVKEGPKIRASPNVLVLRSNRAEQSLV